MTELVPRDQIEQIIGFERHDHRHIARAISKERRVYVMHSHKCLARYEDLRDCPYSKALDNGFIPEWWKGLEDMPVVVAHYREHLMPLEGLA